MSSKFKIKDSLVIDNPVTGSQPIDIFVANEVNLLELTGSLSISGSTSLKGNVTVAGNIVPGANITYDLGTPSMRWRSLYLSGSTIYLGDTKLTTTATGDIEVRDSQNDSLRKIRVDELELGTGENARKIKVDPAGAIKFMDMQGRDKTLPDLGLTNVITSSQQISFMELPGMPSGIVSSSNQINLTQTQNFITGIKSRLNVENVLSGSTQLTSSLDQRYILSGSLTQTTWENITGKPVGIISGSHQIQLNQISGTTFSSSNYTFPQELTVLGRLTAQEFHTELISSSIIYESGSTKFGDSLDDVHSFTGSLDVFGGITGSILATNGIVSGSSQISYTGIINVPTGIVSGSDQVKSLLPAGTVSGSAQITLASVSGRSFANDTYTFPNKVILSGSILIQRAEEKITTSATAATGTVNYDVLSQPVLYYTSNATGNWTLNLRGNASTTLNNSMETGRALTVVFMVTNGATPYRQTGFQIDGSNVTPKWQGGSAPAAGNANSVDSYTVVVMKTANATYSVFESQTRFA